MAQTEGSNYYLLCGATGSEMNDNTKLKCVDSMCIDLSIEFDVNETFMVSDFDTCSLVRTSVLEDGTVASEKIGAYVEGPSHPPVVGFIDVSLQDVARFYSEEDFKVKYPRTGHYRFSLTRARAAFSIAEVKQ
ncbi:MAG: hypothetical protein HQK54_13570 [Oligoflexales bacterium]|nr:hypothetical protein [Oligoflexales bacterium]